MPSLRFTLTIRQKLIAMYSDPATYAVAHRVARLRGAVPGTEAYRREVTCFLVDMECRLHTSRVKVDESVKDRDLWELRRKKARRVTGQDLLLSVPPTMDTVARWRSRLLPTPVPWERTPGTGEELTAVERDTALWEAYAAGIPQMLEQVRDEIEAQSVALALLVGQYPEEADEARLSPLSPRNTASSDGTWVPQFSGVEKYQTREEDPTTGTQVPVTRFAGSRARSDRTRRISTYQSSHKAHGPATGILHTAVLTRTRYGRVVHTIDRTFGGEVDAALHGFGRIAERIPGRIRALTYDKAFEGWNADVLTARWGAVPVVPPKAAVAAEKHRDLKAARQLAREELDKAFWASHTDAAQAASDPVPGRVNGRVAGAKRKRAKTPEKAPTPTAAVKSAVAARILGETHRDIVDGLRADAAAGRALGRDLPPGRSAYLSSHDELVLVASVTRPYSVHQHTVDGQTCEHPLVLDDGALWSTGLRRGAPVKEQRLECVNVERTKNAWRNWYQLEYTYQYTCEATGEVFTEVLHARPNGSWRSEDGAVKGRREVRDEIRLVAPCDPGWRPLYGLRNDCESWFSWLKNQFPQADRAASLDLNHQFLDVLHAAMLTNSITRFHYLMEGGC